MSSILSVALDGPSGVGKSTMAKMAAEKLGIRYFDTGALYRSVGWYAGGKGVDLKDDAVVKELLKTLDLTVSWNESGIQEVFVNGREVSGVIRTPDISLKGAQVAALPSVRAFLLSTQREVAKNQSIIIDGRDIGKVVLPEATVKVFLTARLEERAHRRYMQLLDSGTDLTEDQVLMEVSARDQVDINRAISPLCQAEDAVVLDSSGLTKEGTLAKLLEIIRIGAEKKGLTL